MLELDFDDTFVKPFHWSSISQAYIRVLHAQDFPKIMAIDVYCNVYYNVKSLEHTHTHHKPISRLIIKHSRLISTIVD